VAAFFLWRKFYAKAGTSDPPVPPNSQSGEWRKSELDGNGVNKATPTRQKGEEQTKQSRVYELEASEPV